MLQKPQLTVKALLLAGVLPALLVPLPAAAHRTFLLPSGTVIESKDPWVTVDAAVAENVFEFDTQPLKLDGLRITAPDGQPVAPANLQSGKLRAVFDVKLAQPGTYRIAVVNDNALVRYVLNGEKKAWRGLAGAMDKEVPAAASERQVFRTLTRLETFVSTGKPGGKALAPVGQGLEVVPLSSPADYHAGEAARFRVLFDGKPVAGLKLGAIPGNVRYRGVLKEVTAVSDAQGEVEIVWPFAEMYYLHAAYPPAPVVAEGQPRPPLPERRWSYGATLEVQAQ